MPIVTVKLAKGRSLEDKRRLVQAISDSVVSTLDINPEWVSVLIEEFERENWSTGGELHIDKLGPGHGNMKQ
nr:4-oxalocrotonate tautomerase family protein [uncultured Desulfobacter sp.]